jgi:hypothetical protein
MQMHAQRARKILLPTCFVAIIVGILGMHVLDRHAAMPAHEGEHHAVAGSAESMTHGTDIATASHETTPPKRLATAVAFVSGGSEGSFGDLMMLCGAMLMGAAASALVAVRVRRALVAIGLRACRRPNAMAAATPVRAGAGPPYVWAFSVIRC